MRIQVERGETLFFDKHFTERTIYIGRKASCQIHLPADESVSARHVMIFEEQDSWYVEPLHDHYHRTYLAGQLLHGRQPITDGSEIVVGDFKILVFPGDRAEDRAVPVQVIARANRELQDTLALNLEELKLPEGVIVKSRTETFSVSRGRIEYITGSALKMLEQSDVRALMTAAIDAFLGDFQASCVWIGLRTDEQGHLHLSAGKDLFGRSIDAPAVAQQIEYAVAECARAVLFQNSDLFTDRSAMAVPLVSPDGSLGMVYLESLPDKQRFNVSDLDTLMFLGMQIAIALDKLLREQTEQLEQMQSLDQELARKVQARMAPWKLPQWPGLQFAVLSEPGTGNCTDFYDIVPVGKNHATVLIGHVGRSETDTAISIAEISAAFRMGAIHRDTPPVLMRMANWLVFTTSGEPRGLTAGMLSIHPESGEFVLCLAGPICAYLIDGHGKVTRVSPQNNPLVGQARKSKYEAVQGRLAPGQTLAMCTRGLFQMDLAEGKSFNEEQLMDLLSDCANQLPATILHDLADDVTALTQGQKPSCDITLLILRKGQAAV